MFVVKYFQKVKEFFFWRYDNHPLHICFWVFFIFNLTTFTSEISAQDFDLSKGKWIKIAIPKDGIYQLDYDFFKNNAPDFLDVHPGNIRIFSGHPTALPQKNTVERIDGGREIPVFLSENENSWSKSQFIAFYGKGPDEIKWTGDEFQFEINPYAKANYYFITLSEKSSKRIKSIESKPQAKLKESLPYYTFQKKEIKNLLQSGRLWVGDFFNSKYVFNPETEDAVSDYTLKFQVFPLGRGNQFIRISSDKKTWSNDTLVGAPYNANDNIARYYRISNPKTYTFEAGKEEKNIELSLSSESVGNVGAHFGFWSVFYSRKIRFLPNKQMVYRTITDHQDTSIKIENSNSDTGIWQIKDSFETLLAPIQSDESFRIESGASEVWIFDMKNLLKPEFVGKVSSQKIKQQVAPEVLVIFPEKFRNQAQRLIDYKNQNEDFELTGYSTEEIYNEFSSGKPDPSAIRDFCRYLYLKEPKKLKYLLLLGSAGYDLKNNNRADYVNPGLWVPTYISRESLEPVYSYASDDYFVFLEDHEGEWPEGYSKNNSWISNRQDDHTMDIAVGRIPAKTTSDLKNYIDKYIHYKKSEPQSLTQNKLTFIADNRDYNLHQQDAETLAKDILKIYPGFINERLYLDDFPMVESGGQFTSPEAGQRLHDLMNEGSFLMTYIGHGAEDGLANEKLVTLNDIFSYNNINTLPVWLTATCQFGRFDNPAVTSAAELMLLKPGGGVIALLTTTRAVFSSTNQLVNKAFFENLTKAPTLGEVFRETKNQSVQGEINRNFTLLGDPTLILPLWKNEIKINLKKDTLFAKTKNGFSGISNSFSDGFMTITLIDSPEIKKTLGTFSDGPAFFYSSDSEILSTGRFSIKNHAFKGDFSFPKAKEGKGRLIFRAISSDSSKTEYGYFEPVLLSDFTTQSEDDHQPPQISVTLDSAFNLIWEIEDENGIHIGSESGIELKINGEKIKNPGRYYQALHGTTSGRLIYNVSHLKNGKHFAALTVSDIYNNISTLTFDFEIGKPKLRILTGRIYPNPVNEVFNLNITHNRPGENLKLELYFYDLLGREIAKESVQCLQCQSTFDFSVLTPFSIKNDQKIYFKAVLKPENENSFGEVGGLLFFWK